MGVKLSLTHWRAAHRGELSIKSSIGKAPRGCASGNSVSRLSRLLNKMPTQLLRRRQNKLPIGLRQVLQPTQYFQRLILRQC